MPGDDQAAVPQLDGDLFRAVQHSDIFEDTKRFVDCIPVTPPEEIRRKFDRVRDEPNFDLQAFVETHFEAPTTATVGRSIPNDISMEEHIDKLWPRLKRRQDPKNEHDTLLSLPNPHVVPGGRFREIYYWDSYFIAEGLAASGQYDLVEHLVENIASLVDRFGFVPNGNRQYYLSRSQIPLFCDMIDILVRRDGADATTPYLPRLEQEYQFWMDGSHELASDSPTNRRVVLLDDDRILNRYWDDSTSPRRESYMEDVVVGEQVSEDMRPKLYRNIRAACESGWDFSSRWLENDDEFTSIRTTDLIPVDLNAAMYNLERKLASWIEHHEDQQKAATYRNTAPRRKEAINKYCWDDDAGFYFDYCRSDGERTGTWSLAATAPLYFGACSPSQAASVAEILRDKFLKSGGLVTTLTTTSEQWDAPNGWAPLHWIAIQGLRRYGHNELANEVQRRWIELNRTVFQQDRKMVEKYDVSDEGVKGRGGEYPLQDGFGWSNGVVRALQSTSNVATSPDVQKPMKD